MQAADRRPIRPGVYNVPFGTDFCDATAGLIIGQNADNPLAVTETILLLPNNRAIKAMTEAFVRQAAPGLLLPRMVAIGDLALDEALGPMLDPLSSDQPVWPAINPAHRLMLLAELVTKYRPKGQPIMPAEALRLARNLAEMIDELEIEEVAFERFSEITVDADLAGHWQSSYGQLLDILPAYRAELAQRKLLGPSERRNLLLNRLNARLRDNPPAGPVIAAGITTSAKAIARLLSRVAILPDGSIALPGVDLDMADGQWEALGPHPKTEGELRPPRNHETHPQFHLKLLLDRMGIRRDEVQNIAKAKEAVQAQSIADIFCLPEDTATWRELPAARKKMPHVSLLEASDSAEEARAIAIKVRGALEQKGQRIAVITPDRELAVRVTAQLRRWNIQVDDSAGTPVLQTPHGTLILALATAMANRFSPVSVLAIAKHPLVYAGDERLAWLEQARALDILLRGPSEGTGLEAIAALLDKESPKDEALGMWWSGFAETLLPLKVALGNPFPDIMDSIQSVANDLTRGIIWRGATGRQLASLWEEFAACDLSVLDRVDHTGIPAVLSEMFGGAVVRPPYGGHPRVAIYGLLEARIQQADTVICGGLNEASWPQMAQPDPWLAPAIRRYLGLATLDRNVGLSAHDLSTALGAKEVLLTRAKRDRIGPTVASRFVLRIKALMGAQLQMDHGCVNLATLIDKPASREPLSLRPEPSPSAQQRKVALSITDFDQLKSDPYSFYAKRILRLRVLEAVDADPSYAWRGTLVHDILEKWFLEDKCAPERLMARAEDLLTNNMLDPMLRALWQPRIAEGLSWIARETQRMMDEDGRRLLVAEKAGSIELLGVKVKGRADRIDRLADDSLVIIDYKTGMPPKTKQVNAGFAMQLGLVGLLAEHGVIKGVSGTSRRFEYWSLAKNKERGFGYIAVPTSTKSGDNKQSADEFVGFVKAQAEDAIGKWILGSEPFAAKLHPEFANYDDYDQLMRLQEWDGRQPIVESDAP
jgi:ATP-dependent helicase/nuclease subunit B